MNFESAAGLFTVLFLVAAVPGPTDVMVAARATTAGFRLAAVMIAGILLADLVLIAIAVFSLGHLVERLGERLELLHFPAGTLLIVLGWFTLRGKATQVQPLPRRSHASSFLAGFLVTLGDPKALLFYFGLLPAFVDLREILLRDVVLIFLMVTLLICVIKGGYAWLALKGSQAFQSPKAKSILKTLAAFTLVATGFYVLLK